MWPKRNKYRIVVENPVGRTLGWEDNIKMDLREVGGLLRTGFIWLRTGSSREVSGSIKFLEFLE
jgi:hypothetical protein